jgi:hypothetical protein
MINREQEIENLLHHPDMPSSQLDANNLSAPSEPEPNPYDLGITTQGSSPSFKVNCQPPASPESAYSTTFDWKHDADMERKVELAAANVAGLMKKWLAWEVTNVGIFSAKHVEQFINLTKSYFERLANPEPYVGEYNLFFSSNVTEPIYFGRILQEEFKYGYARPEYSPRHYSGRLYFSLQSDDGVGFRAK